MNYYYCHSGIPISRTSRGRRKLVREIGEFDRGIKLQRLTEERERLLVRVIRRFEKNEGSRNRDSTVLLL